LLRLIHLPDGHRSDQLRAHTAADLAVFEHKLNTRPRKILGWKTPSEVFNLAT
jgi:IS30 family transposase